MKIISHCVSDTLNIGKKIAKRLRKGDIICLFGELGAGKTVLTKGIAWGLGIRKSLVISPSFVLIRQYSGDKLNLYHLDLYRLKEQRDILALGCEEYLYNDAVTVIEWADRLETLLPREFLKIELFIKTNSERRLQFKAIGQRYKDLLEAISGNIRH
jgi:tRNA threonylcarbamoyladenosine biosynthesis protein TsaE